MDATARKSIFESIYGEPVLIWYATIEQLTEMADPCFPCAHAWIFHIYDASMDLYRLGTSWRALVSVVAIMGA